MRPGLIAVLLGLTFYVALTVPLAFWPFGIDPVGFVAFGLYSVLAVALAMDTTEALLGLVWPRHVPPLASGPPRRGCVAVVMTVCDDWSWQNLRDLRPLLDAGYSVYVLDDSAAPAPMPSELIGRVVHVRRRTAGGAKAGNFNHWLWSFGARYEFALLLDADSTISVEAADTLARCAAHPDHADVAVFQSKILYSNTAASAFASLVSPAARSFARVFERVHGRLGLLLSHGHNQLLRLRPVRALGGMDEELTAEDTVLSVELAASGWRTMLVDVWTYERVPETVAAHNRRTIRWARQTVELFGRSWGTAPLRLRLLLCRHLLSYVSPLISVTLLAISLWTGPTHPGEVTAFVASALLFHHGFALYGVTLWLMFGVSIVFVASRLAIARLEQTPWASLVMAFFLGNAYFTALLIPLGLALLQSAFGRRVTFVPTNSRFTRGSGGPLRSRVLQPVGLLLLLGILIAGAMLHPGSLLVGFNALWLGGLLLSMLSQAVLTFADRLSDLSRPGTSVSLVESGAGSVE